MTRDSSTSARPPGRRDDVTEHARTSRIAEIFGLLQDDENPCEAASQRIDLCREALGLMTAEEKASPAGGWLEFEIGKAHARRYGPDRVQDLSAAIAAFIAASTIWAPESQPVNWVAAVGNLGGAYSERHALTGDREDELAALDAYQTALRATDRQDHPAVWAELKNDIGALHLQRSAGDRAQVIEEAVAALLEAVQVASQLGLTETWAQAQVNLAAAYRERVAGDRSENLENSLACLDRALNVLSGDADNRRLGIIHAERSETLRFRVAGNWADNLEEAYASAQEAVRLTDLADDPLAWADAQRELGNVLRLRTTGGRAENLEAAITCFRLALSRYSRDTSPQKWALTSSGLGSVLAERIRGERITNLEEARDHLEEAAAVLGGSAGTMVPHSAVLAELGAVYLWRRRGSKADNAETAMRYLTEARQLMEQLGLPPRTRAAVIEHLGNAQMARVAGDRAQHVEDAIGCYRLALELAGPEEGQLQGRLTNNLASAYAQHVRGDHASNVAQAMRLYEQVASFRTRAVSPFDWAQTRNDAGTVLAQNPDPADPSRLDRAALAYHDALDVLYPGGPAASVITVGWNLGQLGTQTRRPEVAVEGYQIALTATDDRYRESLLLEARYDELMEMTGLRTELAVALARQAQDTVSRAASGPPDAGRAGDITDADQLLQRAVTVVENGRMQLLGELTEHHRERDRLARLRVEHPDIYQDYLTKAERLREHENEQWREFRQFQSGQ
jgi:hypothetical protein